MSFFLFMIVSYVNLKSSAVTATPSDHFASGRIVQSTVNGLSTATVQSLSNSHGAYEKFGNNLYPRANAGPAIIAVHSPKPAVVKLFNTGGNASTPTVTCCDRAFPVAADAAVA